MKQVLTCILAVLIVSLPNSLFSAERVFEKDTIQTKGGPLSVTFIGHGTLMFEYGGKVIHVDPVSQYADYEKMSKADVIFLTHHHGDHLEASAMMHLRAEKTKVVLTELCAEKVQFGLIMKNGDVREVDGIRVEAVPAYNLIHKRDNGDFFHPKGEGNGYVLTFADKRVYVAGDTENIPEMKVLENIDYAFLPMNLPYTMTPEMVADAAKAFKPKVLYPYHYGDTDIGQIEKLMSSTPEVEVKIRSMQ